MELQKGTVAECQGAEEGKIDQRRLLYQIVELAEDIAELYGIGAENMLAGQMLDGGRQRIFHHLYTHISAVIFCRERHALQNLQSAPHLSDKNSGTVDVKFCEHHRA